MSCIWLYLSFSVEFITFNELFNGIVPNACYRHKLIFIIFSVIAKKSILKYNTKKNVQTYEIKIKKKIKLYKFHKIFQQKQFLLVTSNKFIE
jgi:hypothetical protein